MTCKPSSAWGSGWGSSRTWGSGRESSSAWGSGWGSSSAWGSGCRNYQYKKEVSLIKFDVPSANNNIEIPPTNLLNQQYVNPVYYLPKNFIINTNNGSFNFNIDMIRELSPTISNFVKNNPDIFQYKMEINDELNVMSKLEQLCLGNQVIFSTIDLFILKNISRILQLDCFPDEIQNFSFDKNYNSSHQYELIIRKKSFLSFLQILPKNFTIKTKKHEYKCNIAGINSSNTISQYLEDNPEKNVFYYNFDDENGEFQIICDYFNYKTIKITLNEYQIFKKVSKELQIECIFDDIENFNKNYIFSVQKINDYKSNIDSIELLIQCLYNIKRLEIEPVKDFIIQSVWSSEEKYVQELSSYIYQVIHKRIQLHPFLIELINLLDENSLNNDEIKKLKPFLIKTLLINLGNNKYNCSFVYQLYQRRIITQDELINAIVKIILKPRRKLEEKDGEKNHTYTISSDKAPENHNDEIKPNIINNILVWFFPEIIENNLFTMDNILFKLDEQHRSFVNLYYPSNIDAFKKMRESGEPDDELTKTLRDDDVDKLQKIISDKSIEDIKVPFNIYESIIENGNTSLINYCSFYNSIKCFKYLLSRNVPIGNAYSYAFFNESLDILSILSDTPDKYKSLDPEKLSFNKSICNATDITEIPHPFISSIICHNNSVADAFIEYYPFLMDYPAIFSSIFLNGNFHSLIKFIEKGQNLFLFPDDKIIEMISLSAKSGFYWLTRFIIMLLFTNKDYPHFFKDRYKYFLVEDSTFHGNLSILKLYETLKIRDFIPKYINALKIAIKNDYFDIIQYSFESASLSKFIYPGNLALVLINECIYVNNNKAFIYLIKQPIIEKALKVNATCLNLACELGNIIMAEKICDIISEENPKFDCSKSFIIAASNNFEEISSYMLRKNLHIYISQLYPQLNRLSTISKDLFSLLYENIKENNVEKDIFMKKFLKNAISNKNHDVVEFLFEKKIHHNKSLFKAVINNDLKMVDLILKYNSSPSFINKISKSGSALNIAVNNNNSDIVKLLLSIKGINPSLYGKDNQTPLVSAFMKFNLRTINLIIDFYGKDIQSQTWQFNEAIKHILRKPYLFGSSIEKNHSNSSLFFANSETSKFGIFLPYDNSSTTYSNYFNDNNSPIDYSSFSKPSAHPLKFQFDFSKPHASSKASNYSSPKPPPSSGAFDYSSPKPSTSPNKFVFSLPKPQASSGTFDYISPKSSASSETSDYSSPKPSASPKKSDFSFSKPSTGGTSGFSFSKPPTSGTSGFSFSKPSTGGTSGFSFSKPPTSGTSGFSFSKPSPDGTSGFNFSKPPTSGTSGFNFSKPPTSGTSGFNFSKSATNGTSGFSFSKSATSGTSSFSFSKPSTGGTSGFSFSKPLMSSEISDNESQNNKSNVLKKLLENKSIDINYHLCDYTLLTYACQNNLTDIAKLLIGFDNCDINLYSPIDGNTPLIIAVQNKNIEIINLLLKSPKTNINHSNYNKETALIIAVLNELPDVVDLLINDPRFDSQESRLNFSFAIANYSVAQKLILNKELDVNTHFKNMVENGKIKAIQYKTALIDAAEKNDIEKVEIIIQHQTFDPNKSLINEAILQSIASNSILVFKKLIPLINYDINIYSYTGLSLIDVLLQNNNHEIMNDIITNTKSNISNNIEKMFIGVLESENASSEILDNLLNADKNHIIDFQKNLPSGKSYFTYTKNMNINILKYLLNHGANPDSPDTFGVYPLEHAITYFNFECVNTLIDTKKIDLNRQVHYLKNHQFHKYTTYLHLAAEKNDSNFLDKLLSLNVIDVNSTDYAGKIPLMIAVNCNNKDNVQLLFKRDDLDFLYRNHDGDDALSIICKKVDVNNSNPKNKQEYLKALLQCIDIYKSSSKFYTTFRIRFTK